VGRQGKRDPSSCAPGSAKLQIADTQVVKRYTMRVRDTKELSEQEGNVGTSQHPPPRFSVVVPIHNEAGILLDSLVLMLQEFKTIGAQFEMVVCENGSTDETSRLVDQLKRDHLQVRVEHLLTPNYGLALKHGISVCKGDIVMIFNVDFWSMEFVRIAIAKLDDNDMVIGSKIMRGAKDQRPILRRMITRGFNFFLRVFFGFHGTDTHGMKAFRRRSLAAILDKCITDEFIFDSEFVLRAERKGLRITEVPVHVRELRQPSYWSLIRRIPGTFLNLVRLSRALRSPSR